MLGLLDRAAKLTTSPKAKKRQGQAINKKVPAAKAY
jgi:hypothetical protein